MPDFSETILNIKPKEGSASVRILDETLLNGEAKKIKLLCSVDTSLISISVVDVNAMKFLGLETFHFSKPCDANQLAEKIRSLATQSELLKKIDFRNVSVQVSNSEFTLVPTALFKEADVEKYFLFSHKENPDTQIHFEKVNAYDAVNVFSVSVQVEESLNKLFEKFSLHHHLTSFLESVRLMARSSDEKILFAQFRAGSVDVVVTEGKKLLFCNSFLFRATEDALYNILFVCEQLSLNPETIETIVLGELEKESGISSLMNKYIRNVRFGSRLETVKFSYGFEELPSHFYHSVFSHILCES